MIRRPPLLYVVYASSLATGLAQLLLAWWGHILWDSTWIRPIDHVPVPLFGYIATFHWWVPYVTSVPVMVASSVYGLSAIASLSAHARFRRTTVAFACIVGLGFACFFVGHELLRSLTIEPTDWAQWNDLRAQAAGTVWSPGLRTLLHSLGYSHYFIAYAVCTALVIGALTIAFTLQVPQSRPACTAVSRDLSELLFRVKLVVSGWLFYLVLLRSSKVNMWLTSKNQPVSLDKIYQFVSNARPYFEASREGVLTNIMLGVLWCAVCLAIHAQSAVILERSKHGGTAALDGMLSAARAGYELIGRFWVGYFGLCLIGIVLPPPSGLHFIAVTGVIVGVYLLRRAFKGGEEP